MQTPTDPPFPEGHVMMYHHSRQCSPPQEDHSGKNVHYATSGFPRRDSIVLIIIDIILTAALLHT